MTVVLPRQARHVSRLERDSCRWRSPSRFFALVQALAPKSQRRSLRLIGNGLALTAFLVCVTCLILPRISPYKVLLSQPAFWLVAAATLFTGLLGAAPQLAVWSRSILRRSVSIVIAMAGAIRRGLAIVTRHWTRHEVTFERGAALLALVAIGIAQPIFEVRVEQSRVLCGQRHDRADGCRGGRLPFVSEFLSCCSGSSVRSEWSAGGRPRRFSAS